MKVWKVQGKNVNTTNKMAFIYMEIVKPVKLFMDKMISKNKMTVKIMIVKIIMDKENFKRKEDFGSYTLFWSSFGFQF